MPTECLSHATPEQRAGKVVLALPWLALGHPYQNLSAPFPLRGPMRPAHEVAAQWLLRHSEKARPDVVAALRRGYYLPGEAERAYHLYLLRHYLDQDQTGQALTRLSQAAAGSTVLLTGPACFTAPLAHALTRLQQVSPLTHFRTG